jgi:hypothetical protein
MSNAISRSLWISAASTGLLLLSGSAIAQTATTPQSAPPVMPCQNGPMQGGMMHGGMMQGGQMPMGQGQMMGGQMMNMQEMRDEMRALHQEMVQLRAELKKRK